MDLQRLCSDDGEADTETNLEPHDQWGQCKEISETGTTLIPVLLSVHNLHFILLDVLQYAVVCSSNDTMAFFGVAFGLVNKPYLQSIYLFLFQWTNEGDITIMGPMPKRHRAFGHFEVSWNDSAGLQYDSIHDDRKAQHPGRKCQGFRRHFRLRDWRCWRSNAGSGVEEIQHATFTSLRDRLAQKRQLTSTNNH